MLLVASAVAWDEHTPVLSLLTKWDGYWYVLAAQKGYPSAIPTGTGNAAQSTLGFFPLFPLLIRATSDATGLGPKSAGLLAGFVAGLLGAVLVWILLERNYGEAAADRGCMLVLISPGAYVLSMVYSETLLIPLVAGCLLALQSRRYLLAGVLAAGVTAVDPIGIAIVIPCAIAAAVAVRDRRQWSALVAPVLAPVGIAAFFGYLWAHTGTPFAWFIDQRRGWESGRLGTGLWNEILLVRVEHLSEPPYTVKVVGLAVAVALVAVFLTTKRPAVFTGYVAAVLVFALLSPIVGLTPRTLLRAFPLLGVVGARCSPLTFQIIAITFTLVMAALAAVSFGSLGLAP